MNVGVQHISPSGHLWCCRCQINFSRYF